MNERAGHAAVGGAERVTEPGWPEVATATGPAAAGPARAIAASDTR